MNKVFFIFTTGVLILTCFIITSLSSYNPSFMQGPAISPDGQMVCFSYMSDLWIVPFEGGEAKRITVTEGYDSSPIYSPDGKHIAFLSNRNGLRGVYIIPSEGGFSTLISEEDYLNISDWYPDNKRILATKFDYGTGWGQYTIYLDGRRITEVTPISHIISKLSPDENKIIFNSKGYPYRPAYTGSYTGNLWEYDITNRTYTQLTFTETTERYPVYSHKNPYIYFAGSDGLRFQLFKVVDYDFENPEQITFFDDWSVRSLSIARQKDRIVFEKFDKIWKYDPAINQVKELNITIKQDFLSSFDIVESFKDVASNAVVSPNGKLIVFSYKFDLFAMPEKGGEVKRITFDQMGIGKIIIMADNQTIYFTKRNKGNFELYRTNIRDFDHIEKIDWFENKYIQRMYKISDNKIALHYMTKDKHNLAAIYNTKNNQIKNFNEDQNITSWFMAFTPEIDHAFYVVLEPKTNSRHLTHYDFQKDESITLLSSTEYIGNLYLSKNLKSLYMTLGDNLVKMDLTPIDESLEKKDNWTEILSDKSINDDQKKEKYSFTIQHQGIDKRISNLSTMEGNNLVVHVLSDSLIYYVNYNFRDGKYNLRSLKGAEDKEIITLSGTIDDYQNAFQFNEENGLFYVVINDRLNRVNPLMGTQEIVANSFLYDYNEIDLNRNVFQEIWAEFGFSFYDPYMHNQNWDELYSKYKPYIEKTYTMNHFSSIIDEMIGELNASHTGFYPRRSRRTEPVETAQLPLSFDYSTHLPHGIKIKSVYKNTLLYQKHRVREGDILLSIDGFKIDPQTTISKLLQRKTGEDILLEIQTQKNVITIKTKGLTFREKYDNYYEDMVIRNRELVHKLSNELIGYLHIPQMSQNQLQPFIDDLFARNIDKEAVIIDVRGNGGGNLSTQLLDILTRQKRAYTSFRSHKDHLFSYPDMVWKKPLILLIDETSFSDAEIFPILFQQKGLGKVVGMPTSGGVIGTSHHRLMDGSSMRMPRVGYFTLTGINMEGSGATPDYLIQLAPEDIINNNDLQIKKAIELLLEEIGS